MKKFLTVIALISLLTIPALESANAAEPRIRRQRLLTSSRANEHLCSQAQHGASQAAVWQTYLAVLPAIGFVQVWFSPAQARFER